MNGSDKVCDGNCFSEASGYYYEWQMPEFVADYVTESVFSLKLS